MYRAYQQAKTNPLLDEVLYDWEQFDPITYQTQNRFSGPADDLNSYPVQESKLNAQVQDRIKDLKNRIELRKMFAEYEAGNLKPPIYYKDGIVDDDNDDGVFDGRQIDSDYSEPILRSDNKRTSNDDNDQSENEEAQPKKTVFREKAREDPIGYVHLKQNHASFVNDANNELPSEGGVYTEGGLVFVPGSENSRK